jgi:hypothetical protein
MLGADLLVSVRFERIYPGAVLIQPIHELPDLTGQHPDFRPGLNDNIPQFFMPRTLRLKS